MNTRSVPYQPFLVALFICISIYAPNRSYFPADVMILPLVILFSLIGVALIIFRYAHVDLNKSQILISIALILNFTYYTFYEANLERWFNIAPAAIIYPLLFMLFIIAVWKITYSQASKFSGILNIIAIVVVLISLTNLGSSIVSDAKEVGSVEQKQAFEVQFQRCLTEDLTSQLNNRDFYFIILDRYPGGDTLYAEYGYNNSDFYQNLSSMGFNILREAKSNYGATSSSIPSMLNMDYIDSITQAGYNFENNRLWKFFKSQGFKFIFLPSNYQTTVENDNADIVLNPFPIPLNKNYQRITFQEIMFFERTFLGQMYYITLRMLFNQKIPSVSTKDLQFRIREAGALETTEFRNQRANVSSKYHVKYTVENLTQVPKISGRKFVFAHINGYESIANKTGNFTTTLQSASQGVESAIKKIIAESEVDPVIVLLSDHGKKAGSPEVVNRNRSVFAKYACYPNKSLNIEYIAASWYTVNNINTFYLPDDGDKSIYPNMSPVNAWRMILNFYFGTNFSRIEDRSYWSSPDGMCEVDSKSSRENKNLSIYNPFSKDYLISNSSSIKFARSGNFIGQKHDQLLILKSNPSSIKENILQILDFAKSSPVKIEYDDRPGTAWLNANHSLLSGDFMGLGYDQAFHIGRHPTGDKIVIEDFSQGKAPAIVRYSEVLANNSALKNLADAEDAQLAGDFLDRGYSQVLFIDRNPKGGKLVIADFSKGKKPATTEFSEIDGNSTLLSSLLDDKDKQFSGDFMSLGHSQLLMINCKHTEAKEPKIIIADFSKRSWWGKSASVKYPENWGESTYLCGWLDPNDTQLVGDFMGLGHSQVLFVNHNNAGGKITIADFSQGKIANKYWENWDKGPIFQGWLDINDTRIAGDFKGLGYSQVLFLNNSINGSNATIVPFINGKPEIV